MALANSLASTVGLVLIVLGALLEHKPASSAILGTIGGALLSAAVVTFVLGSITVRETTEQVDSAVMRGLQEVLEPIRDPLFANSLNNYRFDCLLAAPLPDDNYPDYAYQNVRVSYRLDRLPAVYQFVCAATREDRVLSNFTAEDYAFRWVVDEGLDPSDPMVFRIGSVRIDGQDVTGASAKTIDVLGGRARVLSYTVPRKFRQTVGHTLEYRILVRKFVGQEQRVRVQAQIFRNVTEAEFRLTVDSSLGVTKLWPSITEVSALGVAAGGNAGSTFVEPFDSNAALVRLPFPLQPGSTIAFDADRTVTVPEPTQRT